MLRLRGSPRLSVCLAAGFVFRQTTGWAIETDYYGRLWRTDAPRSGIRVTTGVEGAGGDPRVAAVAVSVTGHALPATNRYLSQVGQPAGRLLHVGMENPHREAIHSPGDLTAIADAVRDAVLDLEERPQEVLFFYWGPAPGAVAIGHALNGIAPRVQLFEEEFGTYIPSITLT